VKFFDDILKKFGFKRKTKTDEIIEQRSNLKIRIAQNLRNNGFSASEINEVMEILKQCEDEIQIIKDSLIGTNINNNRVVEITEDALKRIRNLELQAGIDMKEKIAEIQARKNNKK